jgi:hypothetical protein
MNQLDLFKYRNEFKITESNQAAMKLCYASLYAIGAIPKELYIKSQITDYCVDSRGSRG